MSSSFIPHPSDFLFDYPKSAAFGRVLPKSRIYAHANPGKKLRGRFVSQVDQIVWRYKLAPETVRLAARPGVSEIQIFEVALREPDLDHDVLRAIDRAIPSPILFELSFGAQIKVTATYKRPNEADPSKWVVGDYYGTDWLPADTQRKPLPVALDLAGLYEQMLRALIAEPPRRGESLKDQVERMARIHGMQMEYDKMELRLRNEKQFNRKVEINSKMRSIKSSIKQMRQAKS